MRNFFIALALIIGFHSNAQTRQIASESTASFSLKNLKWNTVEGTLGEASGQAIFDEGILVGIQGCVDPSSIQTGNATRDKHLVEKEEFFHVAQFPKLCFSANEVTFVGKSSGQTTYKLDGSLTLRGVSKPLSLELVEDTSGHLIGTFTVDRSLWGLGEGYSNFIIAQNIDVRVELHLNE